MRATSWLTATAVGLSTYFLLELLFGSTGLAAYRDLYDHTVAVERHLVELGRTNADLQRTIDRLRTDSTTIRVEARELGIVAPGERVLLIEGRPRTTAQRYEPGTALPPRPNRPDVRPLFRSIAAAAALAALIVALLAGTPRRSRRRQRAPFAGAKPAVEDPAETYAVEPSAAGWESDWEIEVDEQPDRGEIRGNELHGRIL